MTPPPISIDGTDIKSATIDGTEVTEVTIDGDTVFTAIPDNILTQDLIAWYRFEDGDARDYTATLSGTFADTTAYDGTVNGATFVSSAGVTDFRNGGNSGAFDFDRASNDSITRNQIPLPSDKTVMLWTDLDDNNGGTLFYNEGIRLNHTATSAGYRLLVQGDNNAFNFLPTNIQTVNQYVHFAAVVRDFGDIEVYINGSQVNSDTIGFEVSDRGNESGFSIGREVNQAVDASSSNGRIDDVRIYNRGLSASEISDIVNATQP